MRPIPSILLIFAVTISGCLLPSGSRTADRTLLKEISIPSNIEHIEVSVFERDPENTSTRVAKKFKLDDPRSIALVCSVLNGKSIQTYFATEPFPEATLMIAYKTQNEKENLTYLHLHGNTIDVGGGFVNISDTEKERLWNLFSRELQRSGSEPQVPAH